MNVPKTLSEVFLTVSIFVGNGLCTKGEEVMNLLPNEALLMKMGAVSFLLGLSP